MFRINHKNIIKKLKGEDLLVLPEGYDIDKVIKVFRTDLGARIKLSMTSQWKR